MEQTNEQTIFEKLKIALGLVENLKQENSVYKDNFSHLKIQYDSINAKYSELSREFGILSTEKNESNQQSTLVIANLKSLIDEKTIEAENYRSQIQSPKDLDIIRLSILDEVEKKSAKTWTCFENEIEKYRNLYFKTSRELQVLKSDYDRLIHEKKASLEEMKKSHEEELQMFETRIISLQSSLDAVSDPERLRTLTRENSEFQLKVVDLIAELDQIRGEKEHILANSSQQERLHQRRLLDETAMAKQMAVERDCSKSRIISLEQEIKDLNLANDRLILDCENNSKEMTKLQSRLDNIVHENGINNGNIQLLHLKQSTQQENIIDDLKKKINEQTSLIKISNDLNADLKNKMVLLDREYIEKLRIEQEKEWSEKSKLEIKKSELERRVSTLDLQIQEMQNRDEAYKKEVSIQHAKLDKQISTLVANNEELNSRIQMISSEREKIAAQNELNASKNGDFENRNAALIRDLDQKTRTEQTLKEKIASNDATIATLKSQLLEQSGTFQKEIASFNHNLEKQASTYSNEKLVLLNSLEELKFENDRLARDSLESSANFTKQMELFKSKLGAVKGKAKNYKSEVDSLKNALSIETSKAEDRIKSVCLSLT